MKRWSTPHSDMGIACEKGLAGASSSGKSDSGVTSRVFGTFLTWMSDHSSEVFVVATCNRIENLPPEFLRSERWDAIFFVDYPNEAERLAICEIYHAKYGDKIPNCPDPRVVACDPRFDNWTGAEISTMYRLSKIAGEPLDWGAEYVCPVHKMIGENLYKQYRDIAVAASQRGEVSCPVTVIDGKKSKKSGGKKRKKGEEVDEPHNETDGSSLH